jgi:hypothetical protein
MFALYIYYRELQGIEKWLSRGNTNVAPPPSLALDSVHFVATDYQ